MEESLVLVDGDDNPVGRAGKVLCHRDGGILHRAFTALLFDDAGRLLLARRAPTKMLWPDIWDGTVASHPREGEGFADAARRRLPEELGIDCELDYAMKFEYHAVDAGRGSENEICGTLLGLAGGRDPKPNPLEITQTRYVSAHEMREADSTLYCPWMLLALALLPRVPIPAKYGIGQWLDPRATGTLLAMASRHMDPDRWRLLP